MEPEPAHVEVQIGHRIGTLEVDASFETRAPWTVLFGPSGSGKSTILRSIAGLVRPDRGRIAVLGQVVTDSASARWIAAPERPIRWAGQRAALFPRLTVRGNLALAGSGQGRGGMGEVERAIELFGLGAFADSYPRQLSGGEAQRVSVARAAMSARGKVLLLDEPFSGLDARVREGMISSLRMWLGAAPIVTVTHDVGEAFLLAAEVVRIAAGRVVAQGPARDVLAAEREQLRALLAGA